MPLSHSPSTRRLLLLVWLCFLARGFFYSSLFPLWEGYDEYAHFAYLQHVVTYGGLPHVTQSRISREVEESLRLVPLPWLLRHRPAPHVTHDAYWKLPAEERERRERRLSSLPNAWANQPAMENHIIYEALHPPLYYWLHSWPLRIVAGSSLPSRVLLLRWLSVGLASLVIPLGFLLTRRVFGQDGPALGVVALVAAMPELMVDVCRVANESLAIILFTLLVYLTLKVAEGPEHAGDGWVLGLVLGLGLLTKAYFLTALPALALVYAWSLWCWRAKRKKILLHGVLAGAIAMLVSGWWYWRNFLLTGTLFWQPGGKTFRDLPLVERLQQVVQVDWLNAFDAIFNTHIWFGNWSFLVVRSWMYHTFRYIVFFAVLGLLVVVWQQWRKPLAHTPLLAQPSHLLVLIAFYGFFWLGLAYHALLMFVIWDSSASNGWYLYCLVVAEILLASLGLYALSPTRWRRWILPAGTGLFVLLELYATHFLLIPYYTGLIAHKPDGHLASFYLSQLREVGPGTLLERLQVNKAALLSAPVLVGLWFLFLAATLGLVALSVRASQQRSSCRVPGSSS